MRRIYACAALCAALLVSSAAAEVPSTRAARNYRIGAQDVLDVSVYQDKDLNRRAVVEADGTIALPLIGSVPVAGLTLPEARARIEARLASSFIKDPQVSVFVDARGKNQLFVIGEVQRPGPYPYPTGEKITVLQAIGGAGGFTKLAAPRRAHVMRTVAGKSMDYMLDLKALIDKGDREKDMLLEPDDVIVVPQSRF